MDCRQIRGLLPAYLDGELSAKTRAEIEEHLASCPDCRRIANDYRRDLQVLSYQLRAAPWMPVRQRPWEAAGAGGFRSWFGTIGHKALAGTAMVALAALLVVGALALKEMANGIQPNGNPQATQTAQIAAGSSATSTNTGQVSISSNPDADQVMFALSSHHLVWPIDKEIHMKDGEPIYLSMLGTDRTITLLTMNRETGGPIVVPEIDLKLSNGKTLRPFSAVPGQSNGSSQAANGLLIYPGIDSGVTEVSLQVHGTASQSIQEIPVKVDLSPIKKANLSPPLEIGHKQRDNDVDVELRQLTRGVAVSTITWQAINTKNDQQAHLAITDAKVTAGGVDVPVVHTVLPHGSEASGAFWLLNLPKSGSFKLAFSGGQVPNGGGWSAYYQWAFTVDPNKLLAQAQASATAVAQATASAKATPVPTETVAVATPETTVTVTPPEIVATPSTTPSAPAGPTLPADLLYLAPSPDGNVALWTQPSDGADARMIYHPDHDITNFWQVPGSKSVAVQMGNSGPVVLVNLDGTPTGAPTLPDGQAIVEYVPSPDGKLIAYVPADQQSIWIGRVGGEMYQIDKTSGNVPQTIHDLTWAPTSDSFSYHLAQIEGPDQLVVSKPADNGIVWKSKLSVVSSAYSPDGKSLVYSDGNDVYVVDPKTGKQADVTPATLKKGNFALLDVTWRKDGRIGFVAHDDGSAYNRADLWLMQSDGSQAWRAHIDIGAAIAFAWAPSGDGFITEAPAPAAGSDQAPGQSQSYQLYWYPKLGSKPIPLGSANDLAAQPVKLDWLR